LKTAAKIISIIFHPVIIPTLGFIILFNSGYYFSMITWEVKRFILIALFFSTCILPVLTFSVMALNPKFNYRLDNHTDRVIPLLFMGIYYYVGYYLLGNFNIFPVIKVFLIASILVIIVLLLISFRWKISNHMAGIGAITGMMIAISFRMGINPVFMISGIILVAGLIGSSRIYLGKHSLAQVLAGFTLGLSVLYLAILFI
jgi:membrane-associated phospholipid phosphatase